jgi:hypothetical protein
MAAETLVPADGEAAAVAELKARLPALGFPGAGVASTILSPRPTEFVRVFRTGGAASDIASDSVTLVVEAYSDKRSRAERLCSVAVAALQAAGRDGLVGSVPCRRVEVFSLPANLPDPNVTDRTRYTSTVSAVLRRTAA